MVDSNDVFGARTTLNAGSISGAMYRIQQLEEDGIAEISRLPYSIKVLLEAALRQCDGFEITRQDVERIARWSPENAGEEEIPFKPGRVIMQDFTGVPAVVDLAAMRDATVAMGGDPGKVNPQIPVDLVIDHSVQVDYYGLRRALELNAEREFTRNKERYEFLRWGQEAFDNFRVVPPATGIVHQVNLEYLASVVQAAAAPEGGEVFFPDSVVGTDSHTTMINGLGVVGWGVGGLTPQSSQSSRPKKSTNKFSKNLEKKYRLFPDFFLGNPSSQTSWIGPVRAELGQGCSRISGGGHIPSERKSSVSLRCR